MKDQIQLFPHHFTRTLGAHLLAPVFIIRNKIWNGFWHYGWVTKLLTFFAILAGLQFISVFSDWFFSSSESSEETWFAGMGLLLSNIGTTGYELMFASSTKYLILILMEVLIFHASRATIQIIFQKDLPTPSLNVFIKAQIRMIKVVFYAFIMESIFSVLVQAGVSIFNAELLEPVLIFILHCYFLGLTILDNLHEQVGLGIRAGAKVTRQYLGVAIAIGLVLHVMLLIPVAGAVLGPLLASVAATLAFYELKPSHFDEIEEFGEEKLEVT